MGSARGRLQSLYGAGGRHLLATLASLALAAYAVFQLGVGELWNPDVWWQSILVWFLGAVVFHDLVLFPLYALADRLLGGVLPRRTPGHRNVPLVNHVRVPLLAVGLLFLLFFPGIIEQGGSSYSNATGQTQEPFLERWLVLSAAICAVSALVYGIRVARARRVSAPPAAATSTSAEGARR